MLSPTPVTGYFSGHTCGDSCWHARDLVCVCSCGGKNHGILARGGDQPERTAKIGGSMYVLTEVGPYRAMKARCVEELRGCNHPWLFDPNGPWIAKPATKTQAKNWPELQAFKDDACILWKKTTTQNLIGV